MLDVISSVSVFINIVRCIKTYQQFDSISQMTGVTIYEFEIK